MKKHFYFLVLLTTATVLLYGQAATDLSNLTGPTAINQHLLPASNNARNLGSASKSWKVLYLDSAIYLKDSLFMHTAGLYNTFVGNQAGKSLTTGVQNAAFQFIFKQLIVELRKQQKDNNYLNHLYDLEGNVIPFTETKNDIHLVSIDGDGVNSS